MLAYLESTATRFKDGTRTPRVFRFTVKKVFFLPTFPLRSQLKSQSAQEDERCILSHGSIGKSWTTNGTKESGPTPLGWKQVTVVEISARRNTSLA